MSISVAQKRATMPTGTNKVLDRRSLERGNEKLIPHLKEGMRVLDVGCGSGTITKGIAERVGNKGSVVGIDASEELISRTSENFGEIEHLSFECLDFFSYEAQEKFDLVTSARTLQWLSNPLDALKKMKSLVRKGGVVHVLDYNHERIQWVPAIPESMNYFYQQFLAWRNGAGMYNQIGDELPAMMNEVGLRDIASIDASEFSSSEEIDFKESAGIWSKVAELRGPQMVSEGFVTDQERLTAIKDYSLWLDTGKFMKMHLRSIVGYN